MLTVTVPHVSVCGSDERSTFNKNLVKIFRTEYNRVIPPITAGKHDVFTSKCVNGTEKRTAINGEITVKVQIVKLLLYVT